MTGKKKDQAEPSGKPSEGQETPPEGSQSGNQTSPSQKDGEPSGVQDIVVGTQPLEVTPPEFRHPLLRGKSPEEIERIFETQQNALDDVTREANTLQARLSTQPTAPTPQVQDDPDAYGDDFLAPRFKVLESRVTRSLQEAIAPLQAGMAAREGGSVRERLRSEYSKFKLLEPHIDRMLREQGDDPSTASEGKLRMLYHTALGVAVQNQINLEEMPTSAPTPQQTQPTQGAPMSIPQHRPSGAPLPQAPKPQKRELSENEKTLARFYFPNAEDAEEEYRKLQDAEIDEVVQPGFSKEGW